MLCTGPKQHLRETVPGLEECMAGLTENWIPEAAADRGGRAGGQRGHRTATHNVHKGTEGQGPPGGSVVRTHLPTQEPGVPSLPKSQRKGRGGLPALGKGRGVTEERHTPRERQAVEGDWRKGQSSMANHCPRPFPAWLLLSSL